MNYKPVVAGNQSNGSAGKARVETVPDKDYILLPLWTQDSLLSSSSKDSPRDGFKPSREEEKKDPEDPGNEDNEDNVVNENIVYGCADNLNMPNLEEIVYSDDDEDVGAKANMTNLDTNIHVSPIPTTKIYKDHPVEQIIGDIHSAPQTRRMTKNVTNHEPKKVIQALTDPSWIEAMQDELLLFKLQQVWTLVDLPNGKKAIGTKWIFRNKKDERGIVMDVNSAFLYSKIEEEVYVCQPPGFKDQEFSNRVYKVETTLYGLHQAPRAWYETLSTYLLDNGFHRGLQVTQKDDGIFLSQDKYVHEILKKFGFLTVKTTSIPMETSKPLMKDENAKDLDGVNIDVAISEHTANFDEFGDVLMRIDPRTSIELTVFDH
nr:hypothetical protein [Tanacetum cinerariifolium]